MVQMILTELPTVELITLAETKAFMRVDTAASDATITQLIAAVTSYLDGEDGIMGRALRPQRWRATMANFPLGWIDIPLPPTITVDAVSYVDDEGTVTILDPSEYRVVSGGNGVTQISPAYGITWPAFINSEPRPDAVRVDFTAGHQDLSSPANEAVPENVRLAAMMLCRIWYDDAAADVPDSVSSLLAPYRRTFVA